MFARRYRSVSFPPIIFISRGGAGARQTVVRNAPSGPLAVCRLVDSEGPARSCVGPLSLIEILHFQRSAETAVDLLRPARWWKPKSVAPDSLPSSWNSPQVSNQLYGLCDLLKCNETEGTCISGNTSED
ncbi:hypothetical protein BDA96_06G205700 [Sorghum bicolor]|uniref:Uncharacterized protein n=1 Tax=Sorghum bicolor TaxID=4558 RepID=A0A921UCN8_SORBI|nr:hypothetical protein BDA96_06G205700 [Sorghum bicolor]